MSQINLLLLCILLLAVPSVVRAADETPVALPPFIVEEAQKGPPWRYGEAMGSEILSRCGDAMTRKVVEAHHQLHQLLAEILPPSLQVKMTVPRALILYDEELQPAASKEVIAKMLRDSGPNLPAAEYSPIPGFRGLRPPTPPQRRYTFLPNLRLWDRDSTSIFMIVRGEDFDTDRLQLTHDYVAFLMKNRLPALPLWFVNGLLALHRDIRYEGNQLSAPPLEWISEEYTAALKKDPKTAPSLAPLADFFAGKPPAVDPARWPDVDPVKLWQAQAMLFVRWGLDERERARRTAFFKFVETAAARGASEALFEECFGLDFAVAQAQLTAYLPVAVRRRMRFRPARIEKLPAFPLRNATAAEIARLRGDWERLEIPYVKAISAALAPKYLEQARRTLHRAYDRDERDPRLLAVMGLCETDAGNDAEAREYLESAASLGPMRPRACYELGRLRFAEACANPLASGGRLSIAQAVTILRPLFDARAQQPPLPDVYELIAEVWARVASTPKREHLAVLDEGVRLFPRRTALAVRAAELNLRFGYRDVAAALTEIAAQAPPDDGSRERIAALRRALEKE